MFPVAMTTYAGPFVMNTNDEIMQAIMDYRQGKNGFEKAAEWRSEIGQSAMR